MISVPVIIGLLFWHFWFDFYCQTDYMALNKSKVPEALLFHCAVYSIPFWFFSPAFGVWMFVTHAVIDCVSSKVTAYFWGNEQRHWFFVTIGLDQWVHYVTLFYGYIWFVS